MDIEDPSTWREDYCKICGTIRIVHIYSGKYCHLCSKKISMDKYITKEKKYKKLVKEIKKHDTCETYYPETQKQGTLPASV